jgi:hypothetical protein
MCRVIQVVACRDMNNQPENYNRPLPATMSMSPASAVQILSTISNNISELIRSAPRAAFFPPPKPKNSASAKVEFSALTKRSDQIVQLAT